MARKSKKTKKAQLAMAAEKDCREIMERFAKNWESVMRAKGMTVNDLAAEYNDTRQNIKSPLRSSNSTLLTLCKMAGMVDHSVEELLTGNFSVETKLVKEK